MKKLDLPPDVAARAKSITYVKDTDDVAFVDCTDGERWVPPVVVVGTVPDVPMGWTDPPLPPPDPPYCVEIKSAEAGDDPDD